jgi:hypothetical protein
MKRALPVIMRGLIDLGIFLGTECGLSTHHTDKDT